ncbi:MAG: hypothetical protein HZC22_10395 [Rhodocyclales bacterium]|nr:hypothetical protein [Rhodocyclales bacterium]
MNKTISENVASQICSKLNAVALMLRSMQTLSRNAENESEYEAAAIAVAGLCERSHFIIDACVRKMGDPGFGAYMDDEWGDDTASTLPACPAASQ